jgi:hypothetical protein
MNSFQNLEIFIEQKRVSNVFEIWVVDHHIDSDHFISLAENGIMEVTTVPFNEMGKDLKPFLSLPAYFAQYFFKAIAEHLSQRGIKTKDANLIEGKLQATEKHLEDMRDIAKKLIDLTIKGS